MQRAVSFHFAGKVDDFVAGYLCGSGSDRCRHEIIYVHQTAEGAFVLPSIYAGVGVKDRLRDCERSSWEHRSTVDNGCRRESRAIQFDSKKLCCGNGKGKGTNGG